jgi:peptidoglycan pentaglycine glycine transferase (the first glycine)
MKQYLRIIEDRTVWEGFLYQHSPEALFQSWLWGETQTSCGQTIYRIGVFSGDTLTGIAQACVIKAKRGTFIHVRHGPVFTDYSKDTWQKFVGLVRPIAGKEHAWFIRVSPLIADRENSGNLRRAGFTPAPIHAMDAETCWVLDLDPPEDELLANMRKTTRYDIRHAQKLGVTVVASDSLSDLPKFFSLYEATSRRQGFVGHRGIREEFELFVKEKKATLYLGYNASVLLAGAIVLYDTKQAIYHHGASITSKIPVSSLIQWQAICDAKKRGVPLYNFWGIAPVDEIYHPWRGITLFKKGFGGRQVDYIHAHDLPLSPLYIIPKTIETVRKKLRGY